MNNRSVRKEILDFLAAHQGEYLSGERISRQLNITRAAVWKQIKSLKEAGYEIEAQTKSGYRLVKNPLSLDEWAIEHELRILKTEKLGQKIYLYEEISSTNDLAKDLARQGAGHGTVVIAKRQTAGRGRMQRVWESPPGGLWMSVVFKPDLTLAEASKLTLAAGVAVVDALKSIYGVECGIKWPNDVVYNEQKLAGILGEVAGEWNSIQTLILGIGLNANLTRQQLSEKLTATTLYDIMGFKVNLNQLAASILKSLEKETDSLGAQGFEALRERWLNRAVGLGREVCIERGAESYTGVFRGISEEGELVLEHRGKLMLFSSGEVRLRSPNGYI